MGLHITSISIAIPVENFLELLMLKGNSVISYYNHSSPKYEKTKKKWKFFKIKN